MELTDQLETSYEKTNHEGTDFVFGVLSGYPCCTTNMHQSWPKFVQNLFYATPDGGVAALLYAPSRVEMTVGHGAMLKIKETTGFPFRETIHFDMELSEEATFPFHLRIPAWSQNPKIEVNGTEEKFEVTGQVAVLKRTWKSGDKVTLTLPMELRYTTWYQDLVSIERGPLVFSLKIESENKIKDRKDRFRAFWEVFPKSDWNFALEANTLSNLSSNIEIIEKDWNGEFPWNLENAPIELRLKGVHVPEWRTVKSAPKLPENLPKSMSLQEITQRQKEITLVPYGCTTLRITEFPVVKVE